MRIGSLFAGIGGFDLAFRNVGATTVWASEIDAFGNKVLAVRLPETELVGDITQWEPDPVRHAVDVICAGFPCQTFSVAGKRAGMTGGDARGQLFWQVVRVAGILRPRWLVLENVPGLLTSDKGRDVGIIMDELAQLGYLVDVSELDAQHHGVPQRRRRVFFTCVRADVGLLEKTEFSDETLTACLTQNLADFSVALRSPSKRDGTSLVSARLASAAGIRRRMLACENSPVPCAWLNLPDSWDAENPKSLVAPGSSDSLPCVAGAWLPDTSESSGRGDGHGSTSRLWKQLWADVSSSQNWFTTSTPSSSTIARRTYICSLIALRISARIAASTGSSPFSLNAATSCLIALRESTESLRRVREEVGQAAGRDVAGDLLECAAGVDRELVRRLGDLGVPEVLLVAEGVRGNPQPRRKARKGSAAVVEAGAGGSSEPAGTAEAAARSIGQIELLPTNVPEQIDVDNRPRGDERGVWWDGGDTAASLTTRCHQQFMPDKGNFAAVVTPTDPAKPLAGHHIRRDLDNETYVLDDKEAA